MSCVLLHIITRNTAPGILHEPQVSLGRLPDELCDEAQLMNVVIAREKGLAPKHLPENAAYTPHVDRLVVVLHGQHDLGGAIPARDHIPVIRVR